MTIYTVAVLKDGATNLTPMGSPTETRSLLAAARSRAAETYDVAIIVEWDDRHMPAEEARAQAVADEGERVFFDSLR